MVLSLFLGDFMSTPRFFLSCIFTAVVALVSVADGNLAVSRNRALEPVPSGGKLQYDWNARHERILREQRDMDPQIVLLGDSITHEWAGRPSIGGKDSFPRFKRDFGEYRVLNAGFGGDRIQNILWRLDNGELDGINPKLLVLLAGTNNLNLKSKSDPTLKASTSDEIVEGIMAILVRLRKKLPNTKILILGVFPRGPKPGGRFRIAAAKINSILAGRVKGMECVEFADIGNVFLDGNGDFQEPVTRDHLHLRDEGFRRWRKALDPWLRNVK